MRVYIFKLPNQIPESISDLKKTKTYYQTKLISDEGIFLINNNQIKKIVYIDGETRQYKIKNDVFISDTSKQITKEWNKIPYNHEIQKRKVTEYLDYRDFKITTETDENGRLVDLYFDTNDVENLEDNINTLYFK